MTKIVTDQLQRREGAEFTLPLKDGVAGQPMLTDGKGNLYFQPPVTTTAGGTVALADKDIPGLVAPEGKGIVGRIISADAWNNHTYNNQYGDPSSGANWTTYYNYSAYSDNSATQFLNMLTGDGMGDEGSSELILGNRSQNTTGRTLQFSNGNRLGHDFHLHYQRNNQSYPGYTFACMPVRNTSNSNISVPFYTMTSNYWSAGYEGRNLFYFQPTQANWGKKYSEVTAIEGVNVSQSGYSSSNVQQSQSGNITIPANTTILVCQTNSHYYYTTYQYNDMNYFYNINSSFSNSSIICDMRMLSALHKSRFKMTYAGAVASIGNKIWNVCGKDFGDR